MLWRSDNSFHNTRTLYLFFVVVIAIVDMADAAMGYISPIYLEKITGSSTEMGLILATSSTAGIICDFLFAKYFPQKKSGFFLTILFSLVFFFPLSLLVFHSIPAALFGMVMWGIYFEGMVFANFHAIHERVAAADHGWAWGTASILRNIAWIIGPLLATTLIAVEDILPLRVAIGIYAFGLVIAGLYVWVTSGKKHHEHHAEQVVSRSFGTELAVWKKYGRVIWPLLVLNILFYIIESAFFSVGPLFAEHLKAQNIWGGSFVSMYSIPGLVAGFLVMSLAKPFGKKRLAYSAGILAGLGLVAVSITSSVGMILMLTFIASIGLCLLQPALSAVFEDFIARSGATGNDLIGLTAMSGSFAYIIGPILNGVLNDQFGEQAVFGIWGAVLVIYSVALFFIVKRKVKLPQAEVVVVISS
ncbi:MAG: MFS transporter [Candidatus Woesebacteria bacterium]